MFRGGNQCQAGGGDAGGAGLVSGPAGDHPDPPVRVRHGQQQGRRAGASPGQNTSQKTKTV